MVLEDPCQPSSSFGIRGFAHAGSAGAPVVTGRDHNRVTRVNPGSHAAGAWGRIRFPMKENSLRHWVSIWHPRYRLMLFGLLVIGTIAGFLVYAENTLLHGLVQSLSADPAEDEGFAVELARDLFGDGAAPLALLGAVFVAGIAGALFAILRDLQNSKMSIRSRDDLEQQVLHNLLAREDDFFTRHSTGEILNRLEVDLFRIINRRELVAQLWWAILMITSNLLFFALADWKLALVVVGICVFGTLLTQWISKPVKDADSGYYASNDEVKMDFEDYLKAVPEIQVGGLFETILRRFRKPQDQRRGAFMSWVRTYARVDFFQSAWPVLAFVVTVLIVLRAQDETGSDGLALIPVLIFALPRIFGSVTSLLTLRIKMQISSNSIARIVEYEKEGLAPLETEPAAGDAEQGGDALVVDGATYQYLSADGEPQGGISDVTTSFEPGRWSAIVGGAGSGKSTLINLALGRLAPQSGQVRIGSHDLSRVGAPFVSAVATLMPQRVVLLDTSIRANVLIGQPRADGDAALDDGDLAVIEDVGLGRICRLKALEMRPAETARTLSSGQLSELRGSARERALELGLRLAPFEGEHVDPRRSVLDALIGGRSDPDASLETLLAQDKPRWLARLGETRLADDLLEHAIEVLEQSRNMLEIEEYAKFAELAPERLDPRVWELRRECRGATDATSEAVADRLRLIRIGLTCAPAEWGASQEQADRWIADVRGQHTGAIADLGAVVRDCAENFDLDQIHPYLNWRDNLLFASVELRNQRQRRRLDEALLALMEDERWSRHFVDQGLEFSVGRNGSQLSGGQGQLVALTRALLRRSPILVLDEPTSALDPASRDRVAEFLRSWRQGRVVITISHDPELTRSADEVHVMAAGRLAGHGSFDELAESNEVFKNVFRLKKG